MRIERKNISRNLLKKGFVKKEDKHHIYFHHHYKGVDTGIYTFMSHGKKHEDYDRKVLSKMKKQLKLDSTQDLVDLVNCPMSEDRYNEILREKNFISVD
ncbi:MAG TPA: hypothetical protein ENI76_00180 [Ignavibacteria bacterium]|nr:hypothetical protein [Ignavibacteria bacterium]